MFELCPKCNGRKTVEKACTYCGAADEGKRSKKKSTKKAVKKVEEPKAESDNSDIVI